MPIMIMDMYNCLKKPTSRFRKLVTSLFVFTALCFGAWAQTQTVTYTWTGADTTNPTLWSEPGNWTKKTVIDTDPDNPVIENPATTVPGTGDSVIIPSGTPRINVDITSANANKVASIEIQAGASLYINTKNADFTDTSITNNGTLYFCHNAVDEDFKLTLGSCNLGNFVVWGQTEIVMNGACTASSFNMETTGENTVKGNFTTKLSGTGSLTIENADPSVNPLVNLTRCANNTYPNAIGTLEIGINVTCNGTIHTHSGVILKINENKTLTTDEIIHSAYSSTPVSKIEIAGTVDVSSGTLALSNGNAGSTQVVIDENGRLIANKIESGVNSYSNGTGTNAIVNPIINNGSIEISESFTIPNYTNTGDFYPYSGDGKIILTAYGAKFDNKDTTHTVTVNELQCLDSSVISGTTTFKTFTAENLSDKSLTITGEQTIQTGITLSGTDTQLLTITGSGTINTTNLTAEYLSIDENIKLKNYTASIDHCEPAAGSSDASWLKVIQNGWAIKALKNFDFTWTGNTDSDWNEASNWNTLLVPEADCKIIIPTGCTNYPVLTGGTYNGGTLTLSTSDSKITLGAANLVLSGKDKDNPLTPVSDPLSNAGTIILTGNGRITNGTNPINDTTQGTVEYSNTGSGTITDFDTGSGDDYYKLVIKGTGWQLGSSLKLNTFTLDSGANCTLSAASTIQAVNFVFDGKFTSTLTLTLTPYSSSANFEIPAGISKFNISGTDGWLYLGEDSTYTGILIFDDALELAYNIKLNGAASLNDDLQVSGSVTATNNISGTGTLIFTGNEAQQFTPTANETYSNIKVDKSSETLTINNSNYDITNLTITNGITVVSGDTRISNCAITNATSTSFNGRPEITTLTDSANAGNISFNKGASITNNVSLSTTGTVTFDGSTTAMAFTGSFEQTAGTTSVKGNVTAANFSAKNLVVTGDTAINTGIGGSQTYEIINGSTDSSENLTLTASTVTLKGNVGAEKSLGTLKVNAKLIIYTNGKQISASELDFSGDLDGSGKSLTIDAATIKSTAASGTATITLNEIVFTKTDTSIQTQYATNIDFAVSKIIGSGKNLTLATSGTTRFTGDSNGNVEINPSLINSAGTTLTASAGEMTFKADLDLTSGSFNANGGTIILTAENKGDDPAVFNGGSKTFNKLTITGNANIAGNNIIRTLTASNLGDKEITFTAGSSQSVTSMTLTGTDEDHKLWLSSDGVWNISCTNEPELRFLRVKNSTNNTSPATNFVAFKSTDAGNNTNWNFPDMKYIWEGNDSTVWNLKTNWKDSVIPTKGATIEIQVSTAGNYPKLTADLDLNTTLINASGDPVPYNAIITIFNNAELDLDANKIKVGKIINNGLLKLNGNTSDQIAGDTLNGTETDATPTIEYTGTGTTTYFVWDGDADTDGKQYVNLILNRTGAVVSEDIEVSKVLKIDAATTIAADKSIFAKGDVTSTANVSGEGKLIFTGSANQVFAAGDKTYSNIEEAKDGNGNLTVNTNLTVTNFTITSGAQTVFAGAPTITTLAAENTTGTIAFNGGGTITNNVEFKTAGLVTFGDANTDSITFSNNVTHTAGPTQITGTLNAVNLNLGVLTIPVGAVTKLNTSGNQNYNGAISGGGTLTIDSGTTGTINFNAAVNGTTPLSSLTTTGAVVINSSLIKTSGAQTYNSTIDLGSPTSLLLEGSAITFNDDISDTTTATSLEVNSPVTINCSNITTAGNQIYDNTITLKKSPTLSAGTSVTFKNNIANSASAPAATNLTVKANTVIDAANISITTSEFDFSGNISGSGTNNILTLSTPVLKSIAATATSSNITLAKLIINQNTTIETENSTQINAYISEINNSGKTLIIESSVANFAFQKETTVNSHIQTKDGSKLTAWSGTTTFNGDIEIAGDFEHSNGTVKFAGATQTLKTRTDGSTNFYNILISSSDKVTTDSSFIVSGTSWTSSTSTQNFTAKAGSTIKFDNATASAASPTTVSGKNNFYDVVCKTAGQNITFEADNIFSNTVTIGDSTATPLAIMTGTVNISSSEAITFNPNLYCNKLTINAGTKNVSFNGNATYGEDFTNNGTGNSYFKASFNGTGDAIFNGDIYITDNATPRSFSAGSGKKIETNKNIIVDTTDTNIININTHADSLVKAYNFVLYSGKVSLDGTLDTKGSTAETTGDIILLGSDYTTIDPQTGIDGIYLYNQTRPSDANFTTNFRATPYNGEVTISSGATMQAGKNFYANGLSLNGTGEWNLKLTKTSDSVKGFAEAIKTEVSNCKVSCHQDTSTATDDTAPAKVVAYECTDNSGNTNWNFDDFEILNAWTVRDNAIYVEFNAPVRNLHNEIISSLFFLTYKGTASASTAFTGIYSTPDCQDANLIKDKNKDIELTNGRYSLYLKAPDSWNTDATGNSTGRSSLSSDRNGNHKFSIPYIDIPRSLNGTNYIITNRWGKRLNNYSTRTTTPGYSYGTNENTGNETYVLDKTGPVLWTVRTGQEMHDSYKTSDGESSQYDYDAHNFIEFRYSEPVTFNSDSIPNNAVNIPVTNSFGAVNTSSASENLIFAGLTDLEAPAGSTLQLNTGSNGSENKFVNSLYRLDEYSIRISIAGWTDGTVTDYTGNVFKKWPGYIEAATQFTGAKAKAVTTPLVQDKATSPNTQEAYAEGSKVEPIVYSDSTSANPSNLLPLTRVKPNEASPLNADVYSPWDLSSPVFTPLRFSSETAWGTDTMSEAIGNTNGSGSTLDRIDFHFFDNTPAYDNTDTAEWFTEIGWCTPGSEASKSNLKASYSYAADIIGGARPFDTDANRTSGGIRFSTKADISPAFKYSTSANNPSPSTNFQTGIANLHTTVVSQLFTGSSSPMRPANDPDGLYLGLGLTDTDLSVETTFAFTYNENLGYLTDLAGNRLRSKLSKTIDRTPPSFDAIISPVDTKSVYIIFVKELVTDSSKIKFSDNTGIKIEISESFAMLMPKCFRIISIDAGGNAVEDSEIQIDTSVPAQIIAANSNESFTCLKLTTTKDIDIEHLKNLYVQLVMPAGYPTQTCDPLTSNINSRVTFIQDKLGNYMSMYSAHSLSDFAVNYVKPLYAYTTDMTENDASLMEGLYEEGSWAVHDFEADQQNYGTLPANHPLAIVADTKGDEKIRSYLSPSPDAASVSKQFNADFGTKLRVWLPALQDSVFRALSAANNTNFVWKDGSLMDDNPDNSIFELSTETVSAWNSGSQISFMFSLMKDASSPVRIYNNPFYDVQTDKFDLSQTLPVPLFCLRMPDVTDINSLDLWSFKVRSVSEQRGGVSIFNNVIDAGKNEKTVIKVNLASEGKLNVMVMTLDGNIITYLNRGKANAGEHYFTWNGRNRNGNIVARGMYFIRVIGSGIDETRKVMVVK